MEQRTKQKLLLFCMAFLLLIFSSYPCFSGISQKINYQGILVNDLNEPLDGSFSILFSIYDVGIGGTALWSGAQTVSVENGVFNVLLGAVTVFPPGLFNAPRYLGITVETDLEMVPRQEITSAAFSFLSESADHAAHADTADTAINADHAVEADHAVTADKAAHATHADTADTANKAGNATTADTADYALNSDRLDSLNSSVFFNLGQNENVTGIPAFNGGVSGSSQPFTVDSTTLVKFLNANYLD